MIQQQLSFDITSAIDHAAALALVSAPATPKKEAKDLAHGETLWIGNYEVRNFHGYHQSREGGTGKWKFYVTGFDASTTGQAGRCSVLLIRGSTEEVSIDASDRIQIRGERYGRDHWNH